LWSKFDVDRPKELVEQKRRRGIPKTARLSKDPPYMGSFKNRPNHNESVNTISQDTEASSLKGPSSV
jgi:hypothetical protein